MQAFLITSSMVAAMQFAKEQGWAVNTASRTSVLDIADKHGKVAVCMDPMDFEGHKRAVVHVGYFDTTRESQALKRQLLNRAEARHFHIIEYDMGGDSPEPIRICLVCGLDRPCMGPEDLEPGEQAGVPCTFDPTIPQLMARLRAEEKEHAECRRTLAVLTSSLHQLALKIKEQDQRLRALEGRAQRQDEEESRRTPRFSEFSNRLSRRA